MGIKEAANSGDLAHETYEAYAPVYDVFTAHHDSEGWLVDLVGVAEDAGLSGTRLLDVGCGTGKSFMPLLMRGWDVTACDVSPSMLALARQKAGERARLEVADMRDLPGFGEFDLVLCLDDAINYLLTAEDLERALVGMRANLAPEGLVLFDVNTLLVYRTAYAETEVIERDGHRLVWRGQGSADAPPGSISEARLEIDPDTEGESVSVHHQRHFPEAEILATLERAGLERVAVYGHGYDGIPEQPLDESVHTKAIYISRAAGE